MYSQGSWLTVVHYGYDASGQPRWVYADNHGEPARRQMDAVYFRRACAGCDATVHHAASSVLRMTTGESRQLALFTSGSIINLLADRRPADTSWGDMFPGA